VSGAGRSPTSLAPSPIARAAPHPMVAFPLPAGFCHLAPLLDPSPSRLARTHQPSSLRAVARSGGVWCHGRHRLPLVPVVILRWWCCCWCRWRWCRRHLLPSPSAVLLIVEEMMAGPLAPVPPCEQGLAVVGAGCWGAVSTSLLCPSSRALLSSFHPRSTPRAVAREAGGGCCVVCHRFGPG